MRWTRGRKIMLAYTMLAALLVAVVAAINIVSPTPSRASRQSGIVVLKGGQVLRVTVWALGVPDPNAKGQKIDIYSVRVKNPNSKRSELWSAYFGIFAMNHGKAEAEEILSASAGAMEIAGPPTWIVPLKPGHIMTVFFVTRSVGASQYCTGVPGVPALDLCAPRR